ncbi:GntR family transcriptional regulator [Helicovermis profundi]|uniref:GntR family transcriptional regulator n=1 Tax=Helicovermis profundi TaxID=3065157 RepID=A0AAU9E7R9_9FIRM|nr:GntR family transcriptional regulator [Clostridia bacterium S502]
MKKTNKEEIFIELKRRIIDMEYKPGSPINEKNLIEEFCVSRTPIREAILKLSQIGLIEIKPRIGTFVSDIDISSVKYAYEIKKNLEGLAAELAASRITDLELDELFSIIERFKNYDIINDYKKCIKDDQLFHKIVRNASRNPILIEMLDSLNTKTARFLQYIEYVLDDFDWFYSSLNNMANAIKNRDLENSRIICEEHTQKFLDQMSKKFFS